MAMPSGRAHTAYMLFSSPDLYDKYHVAVLKSSRACLQAKANVTLFGFTRFVNCLRYTEIEFLTNGRDALPLVVLPASLRAPAPLNRSCVSERLPLQ
jgi:hypothetical protein